MNNLHSIKLYKVVISEHNHDYVYSSNILTQNFYFNRLYIYWYLAQNHDQSECNVKNNYFNYALKISNLFSVFYVS